MIDLAHKPPKDHSTMAMPAMPTPEEPKTQYPSLRLNGDQAEKLGLDKCAIGDTYEVTLHIKAKRLGGDSYEMQGSDKPPAEFDVIRATEKPAEVEDAGSDSDESESDAEPKPKTKGVKSPKDSGFKNAYE